MKTVEITEAFTGYPTGKGDSERAFEKGETPELSDTFADLIVAKGHAREAAKPAVKKEDVK